MIVIISCIYNICCSYRVSSAKTARFKYTKAISRYSYLYYAWYYTDKSRSRVTHSKDPPRAYSSSKSTKSTKVQYASYSDVAYRLRLCYSRSDTKKRRLYRIKQSLCK